MAKRGRYSRGPVGFTRMTDRRVMRFVAPEKKFLDVLKNPAEWNVDLDHATAGIIGPVENADIAGTLGGFIQNAGASGRIGSKISIDSISLRLVARSLGQTDTTLISPEVRFRLMLVLDKQPNGTIAAVSGTDTAILTASTTGGAGTTDIYDYSLYQRNLSSSARYTVLYDKIHSMVRVSNFAALAGPAYQYSNCSISKPIVINKKFKKPLLREFVTGGATGTAAEVNKNQFLLLLLPCGQYDTGTGVALQGNCRFRYTDA